MMIRDKRSIAKEPSARVESTPDYVDAECAASAFAFSNHTYWELKLRNLSTIRLDESHNYVSTTQSIAGVILSRIRVPTGINVEQITCFAPLIGATDWKNGTLYLPYTESMTSSKWTNAIIGTLIIIIILVLILLLAARQLRGSKLLTVEEFEGFKKRMHQNDIISKGETANTVSKYCDTYCELLQKPYNEELEYSRSNFKYERIGNSKLGEGAFGIVFLGKLNTQDVAIKTLLDKPTRDNVKSIMAEIKIMSYIGIHPNVVGLLGAFTRKLRDGKVLMALELCSAGSLDDYITKNKHSFYKKLTKQTHFMNWVVEIASGMDFLSNKKIIHGDLAARNILLTSELTAKIGDFGLSNRLYSKEMLTKRPGDDDLLPLYWMALETIQTFSYSTQSDIWSYGVTIWEMLSFSAHPYADQSGRLPGWMELEYFLRSGRRLAKPALASDSIYSIMNHCWHKDPLTRPTFASLKQTFLDEIKSLNSCEVETHNPGSRFLEPTPRSLEIFGTIDVPDSGNCLPSSLASEPEQLDPDNDVIVSADHTVLESSAPATQPTHVIPESNTSQLSSYVGVNELNNSGSRNQGSACASAGTSVLKSSRPATQSINIKTGLATPQLSSYVDVNQLNTLSSGKPSAISAECNDIENHSHGTQTNNDIPESATPQLSPYVGMNEINVLSIGSRATISADSNVVESHAPATQLNNDLPEPATPQLSPHVGVNELNKLSASNHTT